MSPRALLLIPAVALCGCLFLDGSNPADNNTTPEDMGMTPPVDVGMVDPPGPVDMGMVDPGDMGPPEPDVVDPPDPEDMTDPVEMTDDMDPPAPATNDWRALSDELEDATSLSDWTLLHEHEGWGASANLFEDYRFVPNAPFDTNGDLPSGNGLRIVPRASSWYQDFRGQLAFKEVHGDFMVATQVYVRGTMGNIPVAPFSLAGLMARAPQAEGYNGPSDWTRGSENYVFYGMGMGQRRRVVEGKATINGETIREEHDFSEQGVLLVLTRVDDTFFLFRRLPSGPMWIHDDTFVFDAGTVPQTLQVGMTAYSDYPFVNTQVSIQDYHLGNFTGGRPDLQAQFIRIGFFPVNISNSFRENIRSGDYPRVEELRENLAPPIPVTP